MDGRVEEPVLPAHRHDAAIVHDLRALLAVEQPAARGIFEDRHRRLVVVGQREHAVVRLAHLPAAHVARARHGRRAIDEGVAHGRTAEQKRGAHPERHALPWREALAVHERAVAAAEIAQLPAPLGPAHHRVFTRDARVGGPRVTRRMAAHEEAGGEGHAAPGSELFEGAQGAQV
jgi:hypothetical protein